MFADHNVSGIINVLYDLYYAYKLGENLCNLIKGKYSLDIQKQGGEAILSYINLKGNRFERSSQYEC